MGLPSTLTRADLTADALYPLLRTTFDAVPDTRAKTADIPIGDALMSAFAMFALKDPSMLAFDRRRHDPSDNFRSVFKIQHVPCDTQMRAILDPVEPTALRPCFCNVFRRLQADKVLESYAYIGGRYLITIDGTGYFSTTTDDIHCPQCLIQKNAGGVVTHRHKMLAAALVHPDCKEVIPFAPEPIVNGDGYKKNDCERNATRRWLQAFRRDHPILPVIVVEDDLAANAPHLRDLSDARAKYIISVKRGSHAFLFAALAAGEEAERVSTSTTYDPRTGTLSHYRYQSDLSLNAKNPEVKVNVLEYWEIPETGKKKKGKVQSFGWITDLPLTEDTVYEVMRGGRARWRIENETFNTLKNQGYNLEHNFGHGSQYLSSVLAVVMMLAFLVDQCQQIGSPVFRAAWQRCGCKRGLWEMLRALFIAMAAGSMDALLREVAARRILVPQDSS